MRVTTPTLSLYYGLLAAMPHEPYEDFAAWAAEKQELEMEAIAARAEAEEAAAAEKAKAQRTADAAFGRWVVDKRVHDDALAVLPRLSSLGSAEEDWQALLSMYAYCHAYLSDQHTQFAVDVSENPKRSLEHVFAGFSRKYHGFDKVRASCIMPLLGPPARHPLFYTPSIPTLCPRR